MQSVMRRQASQLALFYHLELEPPPPERPPPELLRELDDRELDERPKLDDLDDDLEDPEAVPALILWAWATRSLSRKF
jgi:hypothetical protein